MSGSKVRWVTIRIPIADLPGPTLSPAAVHWMPPQWARQVLARLIAGLVAEGQIESDRAHRQSALMWLMRELSTAVERGKVENETEQRKRG
jgi:hypothetical protein